MVEPDDRIPPRNMRRWAAPRRADPESDPGPRPLSDTLDILVGHLGQGDAGAFGAVFAQWEEIAGAKIAEHVQPLRVSDDVLVLRADHQAWATQVRALGPALLAQVGKVTGSAPGRIEVVVRAS